MASNHDCRSDADPEPDRNENLADAKCKERLRCSRCDYTTDDHLFLTRHAKTVHFGSSRRHKCPYCSFETNMKPTFTTHITLTHPDKSKWRQCVHCNYSTEYYLYLEEHINARHIAKCKLWCAICKLTMPEEYQLVAHDLALHSEDDDLQCFECPYKATSMLKLEVHYTETKCHMKVPPYKIINRPFRVRINRKIDVRECAMLSKPSCDKCMIDNCALEISTVPDKLLTPIKCYFCDLNLYFRPDMMLHMKREHKNECIREKCLYCPYATTYLLYMKDHVMAKHYNIIRCNSKVVKHKGNLICKLCGYYTDKEKDFILHEFREHAEDKMLLNCPECFVGLPDDLYRIHQSRGHNDAYESLVCGYCGEAFIKTKSYNKHQRKCAKYSNVRKVVLSGTGNQEGKMLVGFYNIKTPVAGSSTELNKAKCLDGTFEGTSNQKGKQIPSLDSSNTTASSIESNNAKCLEYRFDKDETFDGTTNQNGKQLVCVDSSNIKISVDEFSTELNRTKCLEYKFDKDRTFGDASNQEGKQIISLGSSNIKIPTAGSSTESNKNMNPISEKVSSQLQESAFRPANQENQQNEKVETVEEPLDEISSPNQCHSTENHINEKHQTVEESIDEKSVQTKKESTEKNEHEC